MHTLEQKLDFLVKEGLGHHLARLNRGLEKESLRVDENGTLAQTPHPTALGSALTHPSITTDYSESLLEFVTPIHTDVDTLLDNLFQIHHFTYRNLEEEKLWVNSMPCIVEGESRIPIARYGTSNVARMKEAYRRGLSHRYGSLMQTIAGIHFNFSMPEEFWPAYLGGENDKALQDGKSSSYFGLIRNFHRYSWLICYLFGASPAVCKSFLRGREHMLDDFDAHSFYLPDATSLRLSGLGYSSNAQASIEVCYNSVDDFVASLRQAIRTPHPDYEAIGVKVDGEYRQLNPNLLQIENEFYSVIRPKRVTASGESPTRALAERGVQYVEVRSLDLNPFVPVGIDAECVRFMDLFLLYCLFTDSPDIDSAEWNETVDNRARIVMHGREAGIQLDRGSRQVDFVTAGKTLLGEMESLATMLDGEHGGSDYAEALAAQQARMDDTALTPSARILAEMAAGDISFYEFAMARAEEHEVLFKQSELEPEILREFEQQSRDSLDQQHQIEQSDNVSFDAFLDDYFRRQNQP